MNTGSKIEIDAEISERFRITPYGARGMEIHSTTGKTVAKFTSKSTREENWQDAVTWSLEQLLAADRAKTRQ